MAKETKRNVYPDKECPENLLLARTDPDPVVRIAGALSEAIKRNQHAVLMQALPLLSVADLKDLAAVQGAEVAAGTADAARPSPPTGGLAPNLLHSRTAPDPLVRISGAVCEAAGHNLQWIIEEALPFLTAGELSELASRKQAA